MSPHSSFLQRRPLSEARALLLEGVTPVAGEDIALDDAAGRVVAQPLLARHPSPHYRASAMDGIAVRSADTFAAAEAPVVLRAIGPSEPPPAPADRCCVPVDTGSLLPGWTDAVVRIEDASAVEGGYRIKAVVAPGRDVRRAGEDIEAGTLLAGCGTRLRPWDIGAALATGTTHVKVRRRPRVAIVATGGEVVEPGGDARPGQVIESNSRVIASLVEEWGGSAHRLGIVSDDERSLALAVADAAGRFDAVCVIAGSSAGRKDFTIRVLASLGEVFVHGVDISPGRPVALARIRADRSHAGGRATPVIAVPGYPVAAIVVCDELLRPLVAALLGSAEASRERLRARLVRKIPSRLGMEEFRRVCLARQPDGSFVVAPLPGGAGSISTVSGAHGWLRFAPTAEGLDAGTEVDVELIAPLAEVEAAFIVAGEPCAASAELEAVLRRLRPAARVLHLRLGGNDAAGAVERGEAHAAFVGGQAPQGLELRTLEGISLPLAVAAGSAGDASLRELAAAGLRTHG